MHRRKSDRRQHHQHPCSIWGCPRPVLCSGEWQRNYDGHPEVICSVYHLPGGETRFLTCEEHRREEITHG
jgi:hypothetical protein